MKATQKQLEQCNYYDNVIMQVGKIPCTNYQRIVISDKDIKVLTDSYELKAIEQLESNIEHITESNLSIICQAYGAVITKRALKTFEEHTESGSSTAWYKLTSLKRDVKKALVQSNLRVTKWIDSLIAFYNETETETVKHHKYTVKTVGIKKVLHDDIKTLSEYRYFWDNKGNKHLVKIPYSEYKVRTWHKKTEKRREEILPYDTFEKTQLGKAIDNDIRLEPYGDGMDLLQSAYCAIIKLYRDGTIIKPSDIWSNASSIYSAVNKEFRSHRKQWTVKKTMDIKDNDGNIVKTIDYETVESLSELIEIQTADGGSVVMKQTACECKAFMNIEKQDVMNRIAERLANHFGNKAHDKMVVFWLYFYGGKTQSEISDIMKVSQQMVAKHIKAIKNTLKQPEMLAGYIKDLESLVYGDYNFGARNVTFERKIYKRK